MSYFSNAWQTLMVDTYARPVYDKPSRITKDQCLRFNRAVFWGKHLSRFATVPNYLPAAGILGGFFLWPYITYKYDQHKAGIEIW